jgi:hypothetical protein
MAAEDGSINDREMSLYAKYSGSTNDAHCSACDGPE